jgi:hypothetical protein
MKRTLLACACAATLVLPGCMNMAPRTQAETTGAVVGGGLGLITAAALDADPGWVVVSTLAGAAAGTLVARNNETGTCAYSRGDGTYYRAPCP